MASGAAAGTQISAALMFTLVAFAIVEVPLVSQLTSPAKTQAAMLRLQDWLRARRGPMFAIILGAGGVLMFTSGLSSI